MLYNLFILFRVFFYQFLDIFTCKKTINYNKEMKSILDNYEKNNETISRQTNDIGTLFRKNTSLKKNNIFSIDNLNGIIDLDVENKTIDVGGKTRFYDIVKETLKYNLIPKIVPELSSITVGGAICGISIESSSFKYGWGHDTIVDMDVLTSSGDVLFCNKNNENRDLFNAIPNSYGTIGYVTRAKIELIHAKPYVKLVNHKFSTPEEAFEFIEISVKNKDANFIDAVAFSSYEIYVILGFLSDSLPEDDEDDHCKLSKYPRYGIYYKSIKQLRFDVLTIYDYLWRWDADMFWGVTDVPILKNNWFRWIFGRCFLNTRVLRATQKLFLDCKKKRKRKNKEKIIQDLGVPKENAIEFFNFICKTIDKFPIWICPVVPKKSDTYFWTFNENKLYYDIGVFTRKDRIHNDFFYNRALENKLLELNGNKCFYSDTYLSKDKFDKLICPRTYNWLKDRYDKNNRFGNLYEKVVTPIY